MLRGSPVGADHAHPPRNPAPKGFRHAACLAIVACFLFTACSRGGQTSAQKACEDMFASLALSSYVGASEAGELMAETRNFPLATRKDFVSLIAFALRIYEPSHDTGWDFRKMVVQPVERVADCTGKKDEILKSAAWMFIRWGSDLWKQEDRIADPMDLFRQADAWLKPLELKYPNDDWLPQLRRQLIEAAGPGFR